MAATPRRIWADAGTNLWGGPSPDGRYFSFVDPATGDLVLREPGNGATRRLTRNTPPGQFAYFSTISPGARQVAYAWFNREKFYELRVVGLDASNPRVLYQNDQAGFVQPCAWSPDGKFILTLFFRKDNISQIVLVGAADGAVRVLKSLNWVYPKKMDFSPDGRYIVYDNLTREGADARDIFVLTADGSREVRLVEHEANDLFPLWTPDGKAVLFASDRLGTLDLWRVDVTDGRPRSVPELVRRDLGRFLPMGITRNGAYYYGLREGGEDVYIASLDPATGRLTSKPVPASRQFAGANRNPAFSPDGSSLAYFSRRGAENYGQEYRVIVVQKLATGEERELSTPLALLERLAWSTDGRSLLVNGSDGKGRTGLFRVDARSGVTSQVVGEQPAEYRPSNQLVVKPQDLALDISAGGFAVHPDGRRIAFTTGKTRSEVWAIELAGVAP